MLYIASSLPMISISTALYGSTLYTYIYYSGIGGKQLAWRSHISVYWMQRPSRPVGNSSSLALAPVHKSKRAALRTIGQPGPAPANNEDAGAWPASKGPATEQRPGQRESETSESAVASAASTTAGGIVHRDRPRPFGRRCLVWNDGVVRR